MRLTYEQWKDCVFWDVSGRYGAPLGRHNRGHRPADGTKVYDRLVPMSGYGEYDRGGAYWGMGSSLRCEFTADGTYARYYREVQ